MTKKFDLKPTIVLSAICVVMVALLALVNMLTAPVIEAAQNAAANEALLVVLPDGKNFEEIDLADKNLPASVDKAYKEEGGGYVLRVTVTGKNAGLMIMFGIDKNGAIVGTKVIADEETDTYDAKVFPGVEGTAGAYKGMPLENFEPWLVSGATLTSKAYGEAVKIALGAFAVLNGGEVDFRTPEQILQDNCNAALGTEGKTFTKWFGLTVLEGVDKVYETDGGRVFIIGESFVAVNADGEVVTVDATDADKTAVLNATAKIEGITFTDVAIPAGTSKEKAEVVSIQKTNEGAYVFELLGYGYQYVFDYGDYTPISIKLAIDAQGKIIDVLTVSHHESQGYGDACATEEYYEQYLGKGDSDIVESADKYPHNHGDDLIASDNTDVGAISSATFTTLGYQRALKLAFSVFEVLTAEEGGNA